MGVGCSWPRQGAEGFVEGGSRKGLLRQRRPLLLLEAVTVLRISGRM